MKYKIIPREYYQKESVLFSVEGKSLDMPWVTNEENVRRTLSVLNQRKAELEKEINLNEEILKGILVAVTDVKILPIPEV